MIASIATGAGAGAVSGVAFGFLSSIVVLFGKRARNARLAARGEPGIKDCIRTPLEIPCAVLGLLFGAVGGAIAESKGLVVGGIAGAALPLLWMVLGGTITIVQSLRR